MILTNPHQFAQFHPLLMQNAPAGYVPWYFAVLAGDKSPDGAAISARAGPISSCCGIAWAMISDPKFPTQKQFMGCPKCLTKKTSWKAAHARLTAQEAMDRLRAGGNVGFAARKDDPAVIVDIDDPLVPDLKVETLALQSRSREGRHRIGFAKDASAKTNLSTNDQGEIRSCDEYIVAPGSFCACSPEHIAKLPDEQKPLAGKYTIERAVPCAYLSFEDFPDIFKNIRAKDEKAVLETPKPKPFIPTSSRKSALYSLTIHNVVGAPSAWRFPHPLHGSERTGINFCVWSDLACCWRCKRTLNAFQFLVVKSGYMSCRDAGSPHKGEGGVSLVKGDDGAVFFAWRQAKLDGLIPASDPMPVRAMHFIAAKHKIVHTEKLELIKSGLARFSTTEFNRLNKIVREEY